MELRHLRYFTAVAEELHFGRAAARLNIAAPTVSHQIRALETLLATKLFTRRTKSAVALTRSGKRFLVEAQDTLKQAAHAEQIGRQSMLAGFRSDHPDVSFQLGPIFSWAGS
jgi:DNA-binding transcriptional LysR family regulator